jgi:hypothetical protein
MSYSMHLKVGGGSRGPGKAVDFAAAKLVPAGLVAGLLEIKISGSGGSYQCHEHDIRGSDRSGHMLWWKGAARVGDNTNLVQLLRPGTRPAAAVELLMGQAARSLVALAPKPSLVPKALPATIWWGEDLAQALLDVDELAKHLAFGDAMSAAELAFDSFDEQEQLAVTGAAMDAQQEADEFEAQEHAYATWLTEAGGF